MFSHPSPEIHLNLIMVQYSAFNTDARLTVNIWHNVGISVPVIMCKQPYEIFKAIFQKTLSISNTLGWLTIQVNKYVKITSKVFQNIDRVTNRQKSHKWSQNKCNPRVCLKHTLKGT